MPIRWNSTYVMLSTALIYKFVFARLKQRESGYKTLPLEDDWVKARDLCDKLFLFYQVNILQLTFSFLKFVRLEWLLLIGSHQVMKM